MAKRAIDTFHIALKDGKRTYGRDSVVPANVARKVPTLVYDDGAKSKAAADDGE